MNSPVDMIESERRNKAGYPDLSHGPMTRPRARVECAPGGAITGNTLYQGTDNSTNKALPWIAFSWFLSGGAIIGLIIWSIVAPSLIDSRVEARVAKAEALAELARKEASVAKDVVDLEVQRRKAREEFKYADR